MKRLLFLSCLAIMTACTPTKQSTIDTTLQTKVDPILQNRIENSIEKDSILGHTEEVISSKNISNKDTSYEDSIRHILIKEFYSEYLGSNIDDTLSVLESFLPKDCYFINVNPTINNYEVKIVASFDSNSYLDRRTGRAYISFKKDNAITLFYHVNYFISDSLFNQLNPLKINEIRYNIPQKSTKVKLGTFSDYSFFFLDINFDGEQELITTNPGIGQRFLNAYYPHKLLSNNEWEHDTFYDSISQNYLYPVLDDWTELNYRNKEVIISLSSGYSGNQKDFYKATKGKLKLLKKETYYCYWDSLSKRVVYTGNDSIVTYHNKGIE